METGGGLAANLHIKEQGQAGVCADEKNNTSCDFECVFLFSLKSEIPRMLQNELQLKILKNVFTNNGTSTIHGMQLTSP